MIKEEIFEILKIAINKLIHTDIVICPNGSISKEDKVKINALYFFDGLNNKPEFTDIRDYRGRIIKVNK